MPISRRTFLGAAALAPALARAAKPAPQFCMFSKHLPELSYDDLGRTVKQLGFDGVDLTVRPKGHVLPERLAEDLPRAVEAIRGHGLTVPMITTELTSAGQPAAVPTLRTAAKLGIPHFKPGYWKYDSPDVAKRLQEAAADVRGLAALAGEHRVAMGLQNHSGPYVGEAIWDNWEMIRELDPRWSGFYYDPGHAAIEGGLGGHDVSLRLALPRLKMVAIKDFFWRKEQTGWKPVWCPMGEGAVDWKKFFAALAQSGFSGPVSLHIEYEPDDMLAAIRHDAAFVRAALAA